MKGENEMAKNKNIGYITYLGGNTRHYINGILVLNESLKRVNAKYPLYCLVVGEFAEEDLGIMRNEGIKLIIRKPYDFPQFFFNKENEREKYWNGAFDKLQIFSLYDEFKKFVYLDGDMLVFKNIDHLFDCPHMTACEDCYMITMMSESKNFNAGLMVVVPNKKDWNALVQFIGKIDPNNKVVHDQLILNCFYGNWIDCYKSHLLPTYNIFAPLALSYRFCLNLDDIFIGHYTTATKPYMIAEQYEVDGLQPNIKNLMYIKYIRMWREVMEKTNFENT